MMSLFRILIFAFAFTSCSSSHEDAAEFVNIPFNLTQKSSSLNLYTLATNVQVSVANCSSGYTASSFTVTGVSIPLYAGDRNCLVKLTGFTVNAQAYTSTGSNTVAFTTWLVGDGAVFQGASSTDLLSVVVISQVTQGGLTSSDIVTYAYETSNSTTTSNVAQANITYSDSITVTGQAAPNLTVTLAKVTSLNANGSPNMTFTLQCGSTLTGNSTATYACSSVLLNSQLDYIFIPDTYSQGALTVAQLTAAFTANSGSISSVASSGAIVPPGSSDLYANTLTNGGLYTGSLAGGSSAVNTHLNYVFMVRRKDASANVQSYTYFYVVLSTPTDTSVSGCGTTFAGGAGTSGNPYRIVDATTLANTVNCTTSSTFFIQTQDINLSYATWTPIIMYGQYNGGGFQIANLTYSNTSTASANDGLFTTIQSGASVSNLQITNINLTSIGLNAGALAGTSAGNITNVSSSGSITHTYSQAAAGTSTVGGLLGSSTAGTITTSSSSTTVVGNEGSNTGTYHVGGLLGLATTSTVSSSFASGVISIGTATTAAETVNMGNLIGAVGTGANSVTQNYATGNLTFPTGGTSTTLRMGMIAQFAPTSGSVSYSFAKGTYSASSASAMTIGGMVGALTSPGTINNSYTMVTFSTSGTTAGNLGGFVGTQSAANLTSLSYSADPSFTSTITTKRAFNGSSNAVTNCQYYSGATGVPTDSSGATARATQVLMQTQSSYTGFTFGTSPTNWTMPTANTFSSPSGFLSPVLFWQCGANGISC